MSMLCELWTVESGEKVRWFETEKSARDFARNMFNVHEDGVPFVNWITLVDKADLCWQLNHLERFTPDHWEDA